MNNELKVFENADFGTIRTTTDESGKVLFCGADVAKALGYANPRKALIDHCKEKGVTKRDTPTKGGVQALSYIDEGNVYRLIAHSKLPSAERFESWVFDEVLPAIRKTGSYSVPKDSYLIENPAERARRWAEEYEEKQQLALTVEKLKPKADYTDTVLKSKGLLTITQISKDYGMSGQKLNSLLHAFGVQYKQSGQWLLYSKYHGKGYAQSETIEFKRSDGSPDTKLETKWTQKGRLFIYARLKANGILPIIERSDTK